MNNERKLAVITGASSGIGFELARQCARHGYDLIICAEDLGIEDAADDLATGIYVEALREDLRTRKGVEALAAHVLYAHLPIDTLVLDASGGAAFLDPLVHLARLLVPHMVDRGAGHVLITAPAPSTVGDRATRAFVIAFAEALRDEVAGTGVTVTAQSELDAPDHKPPVPDGRVERLIDEVLSGAVKAVQVANANKPRQGKE